MSQKADRIESWKAVGQGLQKARQIDIDQEYTDAEGVIEGKRIDKEPMEVLMTHSINICDVPTMCWNFYEAFEIE